MNRKFMFVTIWIFMIINAMPSETEDEDETQFFHMTMLALDSYTDDSLKNFIEKAAIEPININLPPPQQPKKSKPKTTLKARTTPIEKKPQDVKNISIIIVLSVIGGCVLLTVIIVVVCCKKKKKKNFSQR
ncbi:hypothetical protein RF11_07392 [Thelohanellus kitauei]|uniref:Uncharacterized protein n=1 Tax=Thelohanellus kitauei TaxID=669202 RepID=A0A0C2ILT2_THEKT|nr:hypothetical protein RF11_07392 [Thelohanellus kitauei]